VIGVNSAIYECNRSKIAVVATTYSYNDNIHKLLAKKHGIIPSSISKIDLDTEKLRVCKWQAKIGGS